MIPSDFAGYSDSDKLGIMGDSAPGGDRADRFVTRYFRAVDVVYWDGELDA